MDHYEGNYMQKRLIMMLAAGLLFAGVALGEEKPRTFIGKGDVELGIDLGSSRFDSDFEVDASTRSAFRAGYFVNDNFEIEAEVAETDLNVLTSNLNTYTLNASWNFQSGSHFVPYVQAGVGLADYDYESLFGSTRIDDSGLALKGAVGTRIFFGDHDRVAMRLEAAMQSIDILDDTETAFNISAGVVVRLGD
jgi:opacity protein-like surface antigen